MTRSGLFTLVFWLALNTPLLSANLVIDGSSPEAIDTSIDHMRRSLPSPDRVTFNRGLERLSRIIALSEAASASDPGDYRRRMLVFESNTLMQRLRALRQRLHGIGLNRVLSLGALTGTNEMEARR